MSCPVPTNYTPDNCNDCLSHPDECTQCVGACFNRDTSNCINVTRSVDIEQPDTGVTGQTDKEVGPAIEVGHLCLGPAGLGDPTITNIDNIDNIDFTGSEISFNHAPDPTAFTAIFNFKTTPQSFRLIQEHYRGPFTRIVNYLEDKEKDLNLDIDFHSMKNVDANDLAQNLFNLMKSAFNIVTLDEEATAAAQSGNNGKLDLVRAQIDQNLTIINDIKNLNSTAKREIEINLNKSRKFANTNRVLMIVLVLVGFLVIFPILKAAKVMNLMSSIIGWCVVLAAILGYMFYELYVKEINRDNVDYKRYNFAKPTDEEIAKSRALAQMSDKDKSRCQAFAELEDELEVPNINLDISDYINDPSPPDSGSARCATL